MEVRKRAVVVEAVQFRHTEMQVSEKLEIKGFKHFPFAETPDWLVEALLIGTIGLSREADPLLSSPGSHQLTLRIITPDGPKTVAPGDFIIREVAGELGVCKPEIFARTYDVLERAAREK